jgi:hypothetical protein
MVSSIFSAQELENLYRDSDGNSENDNALLYGAPKENAPQRPSVAEENSFRTISVWDFNHYYNTGPGVKYSPFKKRNALPEKDIPPEDNERFASIFDNRDPFTNRPIPDIRFLVTTIKPQDPIESADKIEKVYPLELNHNVSQSSDPVQITAEQAIETNITTMPLPPQTSVPPMRAYTNNKGVYVPQPPGREITGAQDILDDLPWLFDRKKVSPIRSTQFLNEQLFKDGPIVTSVAAQTEQILLEKQRLDNAQPKPTKLAFYP